MFSGTVGRVSVSKNNSDGSRKARVRVGAYNMMEQGAVLIFPDENCELMPKRFYWSNGDDGENGTKYDKADLALQAINKFSIKSLRDLFRKQDKKSGNYLAKSV